MPTLISKALRYGPCVSRDHTVLPATHTRTIPAFTPQLQGITALWPVPAYTASWTEARRCEKLAQKISCLIFSRRSDQSFQRHKPKCGKCPISQCWRIKLKRFLYPDPDDVRKLNQFFLVHRVLWRCWLGHLIRKKPVPDMTYNVFSGTLNLTQSISLVHG